MEDTFIALYISSPVRDQNTLIWKTVNLNTMLWNRVKRFTSCIPHFQIIDQKKNLNLRSYSDR